jgi:hypothetical protein
MRNTMTKLITLTVAVAAIAVIGSSFKTEAHNVRVFSGAALAGFIPGQELRLNMANLSTREEAIGPVRVQAYIYDSTGRLLSRTDPVEVSAGQFHTFIIEREDLAVEGEAETGRLQVWADFEFQVEASNRQISSDRFLATIEGVDNRTGGEHLRGSYFAGTVSVSGD